MKLNSNHRTFIVSAGVTVAVQIIAAMLLAGDIPRDITEGQLPVYITRLAVLVGGWIIAFSCIRIIRWIMAGDRS